MSPACVPHTGPPDIQACCSDAPQVLAAQGHDHCLEWSLWAMPTTLWWGILSFRPAWPCPMQPHAVPLVLLMSLEGTELNTIPLLPCRLPWVFPSASSGLNKQGTSAGLHSLAFVPFTICIALFGHSLVLLCPAGIVVPKPKHPVLQQHIAEQGNPSPLLAGSPGPDAPQSKIGSLGWCGQSTLLLWFKLSPTRTPTFLSLGLLSSFSSVSLYK